MALFCCLFVWCCRVCQTKIELFFSVRSVEFFGVLQKRFLVDRISWLSYDEEAATSLCAYNFSHMWKYFPVRRTFITWGKWGCFELMPMLMLRHIKAIDIHRFMYDRFQPDEHIKRFSPCSAKLKKLGSSAKLCKSENLKCFSCCSASIPQACRIINRHFCIKSSAVFCCEIKSWKGKKVSELWN